MDLYDIGNGNYRLVSKNLTLEGNLKTVASVIMKHGTSLDELEFALLEMNKNNHIRANFGIFGGFVFSSEK